MVAAAGADGFRRLRGRREIPEHICEHHKAARAGCPGAFMEPRHKKRHDGGTIYQIRYFHGRDVVHHPVHGIRRPGRIKAEEKRRLQAEREAIKAKERSQKTRDRLLGNILGSAGSTIGRKITNKIFKDIFK